MKKRIHIFYSGTVQGVGFRFTAEYVAHRLGVSGWVKNLRDGQVEVVAEAEESVLKEFLNGIKSKIGDYIHNEDLTWQQAQGELEGFDIRF